MDRLFLDANVLFSAAYRPDSGLTRLRKLPDVQLVTSAYAAEEARVNLWEDTQRRRLQQLLAVVQVLPGLAGGALPAGVDLPEKDRPILLAPREVHATHLLTGDKEHFGRYFGRHIGGVHILPPGDYLRARRRLRKGER
ncbi:MAG: DNA-binding protein [Acidobacteriia bacterium]|nr:DNA-binding protein [Terriglobia bacterium]